MSNIELYSEISTLSDSLKKEVKDFVEFLKAKSKSKSRIKERAFGAKKGTFKMKANFNVPLDDFEAYM